MRGVGNGYQRQAVWRCRYAARFAIPVCQYLAHPGDVAFAKAHRRHCTDDIANHMLQEGIGRYRKCEPVAVSVHGDSRYFTYGRRCLAARRAEGREIVAPQQLLYRVVHGRGVEWPIHPPRPVSMQGGSLEPVQYAVAIAARGRRKARMKGVVDGQRPGDADVVREIAVRPQQPAALAALTGGIEVDHLAACVHPGIGTAGTDNVNWLIGYPGKCCLDTLLHTDATLLALPSVVRRAVVFDAERNAYDLNPAVAVTLAGD